MNTSCFDPRHSEIVRELCEIDSNGVSDYITTSGKRIEFKETTARIRFQKKLNRTQDIVCWTLKIKDYKSHDFFIFVLHSDIPTFYIVNAIDIDRFLSNKKKFSESTYIYLNKVEKIKQTRTENKDFIKTFLEE